MSRYIFSRIVAMLITLFIITTIAFVVIRMMPGSVFADQEMPLEIIRILNDKYHLNEPIIVQYGYFLKNVLLHGDFGTSIKIEPCVPVFNLLRTRIPVSMSLNIFSLLLSLPVGIAAGVLAAIKKNTWVDYVVSVLVVICISVPSFVFASLLQYFIAFKLGWVPIVYQVTAVGVHKFASMLLPVLALSFGPIARVTRYLRAELAENLSSEFMLLAQTKGLSHTQATLRHAFRNSLLPLANIIIPMFSNILGGSLVVESIFSVPGMGGLMVSSINSNDHPLSIAILLFYSFISLLTVLAVDISYGIIDPRVRVGGKKTDAIT